MDLKIKFYKIQKYKLVNFINIPNIKKCTSRELNPGHNDGNVVFYH